MMTPAPKIQAKIEQGNLISAALARQIIALVNMNRINLGSGLSLDSMSVENGTQFSVDDPQIDVGVISSGSGAGPYEVISRTNDSTYSCNLSPYLAEMTFDVDDIIVFSLNDKLILAPGRSFVGAFTPKDNLDGDTVTMSGGVVCFPYSQVFAVVAAKTDIAVAASSTVKIWVETTDVTNPSAWQINSGSDWPTDKIYIQLATAIRGEAGTSATFTIHSNGSVILGSFIPIDATNTATAKTGSMQGSNTCEYVYTCDLAGTAITLKTGATPTRPRIPNVEYAALTTGHGLLQVIANGYTLIEVYEEKPAMKEVEALTTFVVEDDKLKWKKTKFCVLDKNEEDANYTTHDGTNCASP